jgi:transposase
MGTYPDTAVERAMKIQEVLLRAMSGQISWVQAAEIIGVSDRQMRRWRERLEVHGYDGLFDRRRQRPSPKRVALATVEQVLRLYREQYADCNVQHFHELLGERHHLDLSYSWVKAALQTAGLVPRGRRAGAHRRRRERRPLPGMLLHIDASRHAWLPGARQDDLVSISDDATNELYYAQLVEEESTLTVLAALRTVVARHGVFCALYSDRASHFIHTPPAGQRRQQTQVERALQQLGIELIAAHSPQARGRKERLYRTLQGRWPQELRLFGLTTRAAANTWLATEGRARFNRRFQVPPLQPGTAFIPTTADLDRICSIHHERVVGNDNTVQIGRRRLQIAANPLRCHFVRCRVTVHEHVDGTWSISHGPHVIGRYTAEGQGLPLASTAERRGHDGGMDALRAPTPPWKSLRDSHMSTAPQPWRPDISRTA